jgi:hypothetical protein
MKRGVYLVSLRKPKYVFVYMYDMGVHIFTCIHDMGVHIFTSCALPHDFLLERVSG